MDAIKASLRVVFSNIWQVEIKIVGGIRGRICPGYFNALKESTWDGEKKKNTYNLFYKVQHEPEFGLYYKTN